MATAASRLDVQPESVGNLRRVRSEPVYDFIERAARDGSAFRLGNDGYFIVAPANTLTPRFVVELKLPKLGDIQAYPAIINAMNERSCGFLWYDSSMLDAFDLTWRMNLPVRASSPLFEGEPLKDEERARLADKSKGLNLRVAGGAEKRSADSLDDAADLHFAQNLMARLPVWEGGQTHGAVAETFRNGTVILLEKDGQRIGSAIASDLGDGAIHLEAGEIADDHRGTGAAQQFLQLVRSRLPEKAGRKVYLSTSNQRVETMQVALNSGFKIVKQSYVAQLCSSF